jgi:Na+/proline symporter
MLIALLVYLTAQTLLGLWLARRVCDEDDFLLAGRRLGPTLAIASLFATWFGAESCIGAAGSIHTEGLGIESVEPFAYGLCLVVFGAFFAARVWRTGVTTVADLFGQRFGGTTATIAALLMVPTSLLWAAAQIRAFGHILHVHSDGWFGEEGALLFAAVVVVVYTGAGGLLADVVTDLVQGIALVLGLAALTIGVLYQLEDPISVVVERSTAASAAAHAATTPSLWSVLETWSIPIMGSLAAQEVLSRALAARSPNLARTAGVCGGGLYLLIGMMPVTLGLLGPSLLPDLEDPEQLLPRLAAEHMPPIVNVLFSGALVSAMLSTVDSSLLAASSVVTRNLIVRDRNVDAASRLRTARGVAICCGVIAWLLARNGSDVSSLVEEASGFGSAGIFVLFVIALRARWRPSSQAASSCLVGGLLAWCVTRYWLALETPYLWSLAAAAAGLLLGSLLAPRTTTQRR